MSDKRQVSSSTASASVSSAALEVIRRSRPEDYDGHTEFARLPPRERLAWLESAIRFIQSRKVDRQTSASSTKSV